MTFTPTKADAVVLRQALFDAETKLRTLLHEKNDLNHMSKLKTHRINKQELKIVSMREKQASTYDDYEAASRENKKLAEAINQLSRKVTFHKAITANHLRANVKLTQMINALREELFKSREKTYEDPEEIADLKKTADLWEKRSIAWQALNVEHLKAVEDKNEEITKLERDVMTWRTRFDIEKHQHNMCQDGMTWAERLVTESRVPNNKDRLMRSDLDKMRDEKEFAIQLGKIWRRKYHYAMSRAPSITNIHNEDKGTRAARIFPL